MIQPAAFYEALRGQGFTYFTGVPDSLLKDLCGFITDHAPENHHVIAANEGGAVALAAGHHLATGAMPVVYLQNSGTGNIVNPLLSLTDPAVYRIPILFVIGWRGEPGVADEPQHVTQGRVMPALLEAIGLDYDIVAADTDPTDVIGRAHSRMVATGSSSALLVRKGTFSAYRTVRQLDDVSTTRTEAVEEILRHLGPTDVVVSTTGMTSREVFAFREKRGEGHTRDFLTVGAMGHCSQIALGVAQQRPQRQVVCLDGDGAAIMHMGAMAIIGTQKPTNLKHIIINNGAHDSVGGQPTAGHAVDLCGVARACGYQVAEMVDRIDDISAAVARLRHTDGPTMLEIRVGSRATTAAGRPTTTPLENKLEFMTGLKRGSD